jgi:hypothetical protein
MSMSLVGKHVLEASIMDGSNLKVFDCIILHFVTSITKEEEEEEVHISTLITKILFVFSQCGATAGLLYGSLTSHNSLRSTFDLDNIQFTLSQTQQQQQQQQQQHMCTNKQRETESFY